MESYFSEDQSEITFTIEENKNEDHIDRALRNLKELQRQNEMVLQEMEKIKSNPKVFIKPIRDQLTEKINQLREENESLRRMVEKTKIPAYCQMTKKKITTQYEQQQSNYESMRGSYRNRNPLDEIESNYDKNDARSTCLNYNQTDANTNQLTFLPNPNDHHQRQQLTNQIRALLDKAEAFEQELEKISKKQKYQLKATNKRDQATQRQLARIYDYKKRLIKLLSRLKNREIAIKELIETYKQMHQETFQKLKQASNTLQKLRQAKISQDVDQKYAEVLQLEQRLHSIDAQLEEMDDTRWLEEITKELAHAVRRMGIEVPKCENSRELIDELCGILIECHISSRKDGQAKLNLLRQYHEEQKKNNSKYIMALKSKEQALGRKLIDMQMEK